MLLSFSFMVMLLSLVDAYNQPACYAPFTCHKPGYFGRQKEVYGPARVCMGNNYRWNDARKQCKEIDLRLCSSMEICRKSADPMAPAFQPSAGSIMTPVIDEPNEWLQVGDNVRSGHPEICERYIRDKFPSSIGPTEGTQNSHRSWKGSVYCCPKTKIIPFHLDHHVTWQQASDFCEAQVVDKLYPHYAVAHPEKDEKDYYRLCDRAAICDYDFYGQTITRGPGADKESWTPVADSHNEWASLDYQSDLCNTYTELHGGNKPTWGTDDTCEHDFRGFVYCCRDERRVVTYHTHDEVGKDAAEQDHHDGAEYDSEVEYMRSQGSVRFKKNTFNGQEGRTTVEFPEAKAYIKL